MRWYSHKKLLQLVAMAVVWCVLLTSSVRANDDEQRDPFEKFNRPAFAVNMFFDRMLLKPLAKTYRTVVPKSFRIPLENFISQFSYPVSAFNYVLQGDFKNAGNSVVRLSVNMILTMGMGHVPIGDTPYVPQNADSSMAQAGVGSGPYLVLPFLGNNMVRGYAGQIVDGKVQGTLTAKYISPPTFAVLQTPTFTLLQMLVGRAKILDASEEFEKTSLDYYATVRSVVIQRSDSYEETAPFDDFSDFDFSE